MTKITYESTEELGHSIPLSKREIEEDMLEELCSLAKKDALIGISEICGRMKMSRREVLACLKQLTAQGYVKIEEKNICVCLTELGRIRGEECRHRHENFTQLLEYVGVESRIAEEDACRMEHVVSDETVQQICNFVNYGSTFEHALRNTDLRYRYEPREYSFLMGIYYMEKTCPRRLAGEFKNYKEQIRLHVKKEDSYFELFCTAPEEKNCSLVCGPRRNRAGSLLLDEPTSNLDSLNEGIILKSLKEDKANRTVVLVSHRTSTMKVADVVYEMENGRVS